MGCGIVKVLQVSEDVKLVMWVEIVSVSILDSIFHPVINPDSEIKLYGSVTPVAMMKFWL